MRPGDVLRAEARESGYAATSAARRGLARLAAHHEARAALLVRAAEAADDLATRPTSEERAQAEDARADEVLDAYLRPWRDEQRLLALRTRAAFEAAERVAEEKRRAERRGAR